MSIPKSGTSVAKQVTGIHKTGSNVYLAAEKFQLDSQYEQARYPSRLHSVPTCFKCADSSQAEGNLNAGTQDLPHLATLSLAAHSAPTLKPKARQKGQGRLL